MRFAVDVDGVVFKRGKYPALGDPNWDIVYALKDLQALGHKVHMFTARTGAALDVVKGRLREINFYFDPYDFPLTGNKIRADFYVDDRAIQPTALGRIVDGFIHNLTIEDRWQKE